jgi:hypothetical protein
VSLANALVQSACPVALLVGDLTLAERYVKALMDLSARHTLRRWNLAGRFFEGVLRVKRGEIGTGLELLRTVFSRIPQNTFILFPPLFLAEIADALGRDAKAAEGLSIIDEALARFAQATGVASVVQPEAGVRRDLYLQCTGAGSPLISEKRPNRLSLEFISNLKQSKARFWALQVTF